MSVLFESLPRILFEPIAVAALLGLLTAFYVYRKQHTPLFWIVIISLLFMIGWRTFIHIGSSRYASILLYPGIIAAVYFCFQLKQIRKIFPVLPEKVSELLPWLFLIGLSIACLVKSLHYNPYESYIRDTCSVAAADASHFRRPVALTPSDEFRRYRYYSGLKTYGDAKLDFPSGVADAAVIRRLLTRYSSTCDVLYLFFDESSTSEPLSAAALKVSPEQWKLLAQHEQNRHKKKQLRLYRDLPPASPAKTEKNSPDGRISSNEQH